MATAALVPVEEYLATTYKPACDYVDGVLYQKSMPTRKHSVIQSRFSQLMVSFPDFEANTELTVQIRTGKFLVPDFAVQDRDRIQEPYPTEPSQLCVEFCRLRTGSVRLHQVRGLPRLRRRDRIAPGISIPLPELFSVLS